MISAKRRFEQWLVGLEDDSVVGLVRAANVGVHLAAVLALWALLFILGVVVHDWCRAVPPLDARHGLAMAVLLTLIARALRLASTRFSHHDSERTVRDAHR